MLKSALLLLSMTASGDVRMSLSETVDAQDCSFTRGAVLMILEEAGMTPLHAVCGETGLSLTPFERRSPKPLAHRYRVELPSEGGYRITPLELGAACTPDHEADPAVFCTVSQQEVIQ